ncbi:MAG: hypothetical protein MRERV_26c017 [Mycoplasmataceae bacterium RV_VA103A]|nr:MAG: hypothetical protein MRERV_26c017 [Mycoplasmataceae bacterium RV_VA103A]
MPVKKQGWGIFIILFGVNANKYKIILIKYEFSGNIYPNQKKLFFNQATWKWRKTQNLLQQINF